MSKYDPDIEAGETDASRPALVFFYPPSYGFGLLPEPLERKFRLAVFLDPRIPHFVVPIPSSASAGTFAYQLEGPTRSGGTEQVTVSLDGEGSFGCTCSPHNCCDHIRAVRSLGLFTREAAPYRV